MARKSNEDSLETRLEQHLDDKELKELQHGQRFTFDGKRLLPLEEEPVDQVSPKLAEQTQAMKKIARSSGGRRVTVSSFSINNTEEKDGEVVAPYGRTAISPVRKGRTSSRSSLNSSPSTSPRISPVGKQGRGSGRRASLSLSRSSGHRLPSPHHPRVPSNLSLETAPSDELPRSLSSSGSRSGREFSGSAELQRPKSVSPKHARSRTGDSKSRASKDKEDDPVVLDDQLQEYRRKFVHEYTLDSLPEELVASLATHIQRRSVLEVQFQPTTIKLETSVPSPKSSSSKVSLTPSTPTASSTLSIPTTPSTPHHQPTPLPSLRESVTLTETDDMKSAPELPSTSSTSTSTSVPTRTSSSTSSSTSTTTGLTTLEVPSTTQVVPGSSPTGGKKTVMFAESVHVIIEEPRHSVSVEHSQSSVPRPSTEKPLSASKAPKGILKTKVRQETIEEVMNRILDEREKEAKSLTEMCAGALLTKYSSTGKPNKRWVSVSEDGTEISWRKPSKTERRVDYKVKTAKSKGKKKGEQKGGKWPTFRLWNLKINASRTRSLIDVIGVHYGPYASDAGFSRYMQKRDSAAGYPWLCLTIEFVDRTLDLVCKDTKEVTTWFLGIQALAPLSVHFLSRGAMLWQRLIMLLNFYGFERLLNPTFPWTGPTKTTQKSSSARALSTA